MDRFLVNYLKNIVPVTFNLETAEEFLTIGKNIPKFTVRINNPLRKKDLMTSTSLSLAEAYMRRDIEVDEDLYEVLNSFISSIDSFKTNRTLLHHLLSTSRSEINQKKEVTSHYDIGNEFYRLWLDETMSYSCGYFKEDDDDLYTAQLNKVELTLSKLHLEKGMRLLDVGCGWGFLLVHAAKKYGIHGTGITLSEEQYKKFSETIKQEGLSELLEVRLMDYRELANSGMKFDRVVSIGMIEHVGRGNYELFLDNIKAVLQPSGVFLLHFISSLQEHSGDPFIKKYIFPGGVIPSLREILSVMGNKQLYCLDVESLRRHYTRTLLFWRTNLLSHKEEITNMYGDKFMRMWELYLASCAATFWNGIIDLHQIVMTNGVNNELPMNRIV